MWSVRVLNSDMGYRQRGVARLTRFSVASVVVQCHSGKGLATIRTRLYFQSNTTDIYRIFSILAPSCLRGENGTFNNCHACFDCLGYCDCGEFAPIENGDLVSKVLTIEYNFYFPIVNRECSGIVFLLQDIREYCSKGKRIMYNTMVTLPKQHLLNHWLSGTLIGRLHTKHISIHLRPYPEQKITSVVQLTWLPSQTH